VSVKAGSFCSLQLFGDEVSKHVCEIRVMNVVSLLANLRTVNTAYSGIYEVCVNLLKPSVHHSQILRYANTVYVFCTDLRTNSDYFPL